MFIALLLVTVGAFLASLWSWAQAFVAAEKDNLSLTLLNGFFGVVNSLWFIICVQHLGKELGR